MRVRFIPLIASVAAGLLLVAPSAAAPPAGMSVAIERQATLVTSGTVALRVTVECPAGTNASVQGSISQQQPVGPNTFGLGDTPVMCTGSKQTVTVLIAGGPFTAGDAFAGVIGFDEIVGVAQDQRVIAIS